MHRVRLVGEHTLHSAQGASVSLKVKRTESHTMKNTLKLLALVGIVGTAAIANAQVTAVTNIAGTFIDISSTGTSLGASNQDDAAFSISATHGNRILAAGNIFASTNGLVSSAASTAFTNNPVASTANGTYCVFWDDLIFRGPGDMYVQNLADRTIIQWNAVQHFSSSPSTATFQLQIFDEGGPVLAQMLYSDIDFGDSSSFGASATIGAHLADNSVTEFSMNNASIQDGSVVSFVVPAPGAAAAMGLSAVAGLRRRRR